jgi:hypothetical protein
VLKRQASAKIRTAESSAFLLRPMSYYTFRKESEKSSKIPQKHIHLGIPINIATGPLGFRAELDTDPIGSQN